MTVEKDDLAAAIGNATIAWNSCQLGVFLIFWRLSGMPRSCAESVFSTVKSDSAQRDITGALASTRLEAGSEILNELKEQLSFLNKSAKIRNAAVHTLWTEDSAGHVSPTDFIKSHRSLIKDGFLRQFTKIVEELTDTNVNLTRILIQINDISSFPAIEYLQIQDP